MAEEQVLTDLYAPLMMAGFRDAYQDALLEKAPYSRSDQANYRPWTRRFAQSLYSTSHMSI